MEETDRKKGKTHACSSCYRIFSAAIRLKHHLETGCDRRPSQYGCPNCHRDCKNRHGFHYHKKVCEGGRPPPEESPPRVEHLEQQIRDLQEKLNRFQPHQTIHQVIHNNTQNNTVILNFEIGKGTQYDTSHITPQKVGRILHKFRPELLPQASHHFLQLIYSNPVNRNIFKRSLYTKICEVLTDKEWRSMPESDILKTLTYDVFSAVLDTYEQMEATKKSDEHAEILNLIVSDEVPYEPKACEAMRAALVDVTRKYYDTTPRESVAEV